MPFSRARPGVLVAMFFVLGFAACKETGTVQVTSITFRGNKAVPASQLKTVIATQESGFLPWSRKHFFDRPEFDRDVKRIEAFYADRGYPSAKVASVDVKLNDAKDKVAVVVDISEGNPIVVENVSFEGLDALPPDHVAQLKDEFGLKPGQPRDQKQILIGHDQVVGELRDHGYPYGTARIVERPGSTPERVQIAVVADTGPKAVFGPVEVEGDVSVSENVIRRELALREGDEYRASRITESQRRLYGLELFQFVNITPRMPEDRVPAVPVSVTVVEGKHRRLQLAAGYGSEERVRGRVNWRHVNFWGGARTMEMEGKWSSLEHGVRATFTEPYLLGPGLSIQLSGSSWWASEPAYTYRSKGGRAVLTKQLSRGPAGVVRGVRNELRASLIHEYEDYAISTAALDDPTIRDQLIALGLDPVTGKGKGTLSAIALDFERDTSGQPLNPQRGYSASVHLETAGTLAGGSFSYNELLGEGRRYFELRPGLVWANRIRAGALAGSDGAAIPFFKRYFAGGSTSVRGWGRYQISPLTPAGLAIGGRTTVEVSSEARFGLAGKFSGVFFVDGGAVSLDAWKVQATDLRWAVGPGLRYDTPIGPMRVDLGFQLNPIPGLVINGSSKTRPWRIHFSIGQAF